MTLACVLAVASLIVEGASPRPVPFTWVQHAIKFGERDLDEFAFKAVERVRRADWDGTVALCTESVLFSVFEPADANEPQAPMLFDDTVSTGDDEVVASRVRQVKVDTDDPPSVFVKSQFSYFASLVEGTVESSNSVPVWNGSAITGTYASNATWTIRLAKTSKGWRMTEFVLESK